MSGAVKNEGVSIIVCCYNSASRLPETLRHIALQKITDDILWEVILINNNSSDDTVIVARSEWAKYNCKISLKVVEEPNPGLSYARHRGVKSAQYEYIIFCDDDNWLNSNYVQTAFEVMDVNHKIGILGGDSFDVCEIDPPDWFESNKRDYAVGRQGVGSGDADYRWFIWGAGMVIRKNYIRHLFEIGMHSYLNDRKGTVLSAGGDNEMCKWYLLGGYKLWHDNRLSLKHFIPKERLSESYWKRMWEGFNKTDYWLGRYDILIHIKNQRNSKLKNFSLGIKYLLLLRKNVFVIKNIDLTRTYIQFLMGPFLNISTKEEFSLIKFMYPFLYKNFVPYL